MSSQDMSTPVTRGELREELRQLEERIEERMDKRFVDFETRIEARFDHKLEMWGGALLARIEASEQRLLTELARHVKAIQEDGSRLISVIDEKYKDLPARVSRLETRVFHRKQR